MARAGHSAPAGLALRLPVLVQYVCRFCYGFYFHRLVAQPFEPFAPGWLLLLFAQFLLPHPQFDTHDGDDTPGQIQYQIYGGDAFEGQEPHGFK